MNSHTMSYYCSVSYFIRIKVANLGDMQPYLASYLMTLQQGVQASLA